MVRPDAGDLIDIHTHDSARENGIFSVENILAHTVREPDDECDCFSVGAHPWFLRSDNVGDAVSKVAELARHDRVVAVGEAGYDRRRGGDIQLQQRCFEDQAAIADELDKPLIIHCVKMWDELWASRKRLSPDVPWIIHGFNGGKEQALQLVSGGFMLSLWARSLLSRSLDVVIAALPASSLFIETDGLKLPLKELYGIAAEARSSTVDELTATIHSNYERCFLSL